MRTLLLVVVCTAALPDRALARPQPPEPAQQLATDATWLASRGYRLRGLEVAEQGKHIRMALLMAGDAGAYRLELTVADGGRTATAYRSLAAPVPAEARSYLVETDLMALLAGGPPQRLREECGRWYLDGTGGASAMVDPRDYHVVERSVAAGLAGPLLSELLAGALDGGAELAWAGAAGDEEWAIDFELHGERRLVLRARVDGRFKVIGLEVRVSPPVPGWQVYRRPAELAAALRAGGRIHALVVEPEAGDHGRLVVRMRGARFAIDLGDFAPGSAECPC